LLAAAVVVVAINLRASITVVGPIVDDIRDDLGLSSAAAGLLTTLPVLAFAFASPVAGPLARRIGIERTLAGALALIVAGALLRVTGSVWAAFAGTGLIGVGIAGGNVLLPALVKRDLPERVGPVTSLYVTVMVSFAAIASTVAVPLAEDMGLGWEGALAVWGIPAAAGLAIWLPRALRNGSHESRTGSPPPRATRMRGSAIAWWVTAFMGLQSFSYYALIAWLPELLQDSGVSAARAGVLMGVMQAVSIGATIAVPILAGRSRDQRGIVVASTLLGTASSVGLLIAPGDLALVWSAGVGLAGGATISLALTLFALRTRDGTDAAALSGMAQSIGYGIAAVGPFMIGALHDATDGWDVPAVIFIVDWVLIGVSGLFAGRALVISAR
jgi:CP family cyanate transporter-like MFS transporter